MYSKKALATTMSFLFIFLSTELMARRGGGHSRSDRGGRSSASDRGSRSSSSDRSSRSSASERSSRSSRSDRSSTRSRSSSSGRKGAGHSRNDRNSTSTGRRGADHRRTNSSDRNTQNRSDHRTSYPRHDHDRDYDHDYPRYPRRGGTSCSPEVELANVQAAELTLQNLASKPEFKSATTFQKMVIELKDLPSLDEKIDALFDLVDVNANNIDEIAHFIGARKVETEKVIYAADRLELSNQQALTVLSALQKQLRGNL